MEQFVQYFSTIGILAIFIGYLVRNEIVVLVGALMLFSMASMAQWWLGCVLYFLWVVTAAIRLREKKPE